MRLLDLFKEVEESNLSKEQLEQYYSELSMLSAKISLEIATLKKAEGMFMGEKVEQPAVQRKRDWRASTEGQRLIDLEGYKKASSLVLDSIKTRIYAKL